jgi:hypothetical protein
MADGITQANREHYRKLLATEKDAAKRTELMRLLAEQSRSDMVGAIGADTMSARARKTASIVRPNAFALFKLKELIFGPAPGAAEGRRSSGRDAPAWVLIGWALSDAQWPEPPGCARTSATTVNSRRRKCDTVDSLLSHLQPINRVRAWSSLPL